jgi:F-type H+-transporting ATPase subunit b
MRELLFPFLNLVILIVIMVVYLREPLRAFVKTRHESLRDELQRVRTLLSQSQAKYEEFTGKLKAMEAEIVTLRDQAKQDAQSSKTRLIAEAQKLSTAIVNDARASAGGLYSSLRHELSAEVGKRVLDRAESLLKDRLTGDDRVRIRGEFSTQLGAAR